SRSHSFLAQVRRLGMCGAAEADRCDTPMAGNDEVTGGLVRGRTVVDVDVVEPVTGDALADQHQRERRLPVLDVTGTKRFRMKDGAVEHRSPGPKLYEAPLALDVTMRLIHGHGVTARGGRLHHVRGEPCEV